jgi:hypothetical protein
MEYKKENLVQWFCGFYEGEGYVSNDKSNNNRLRLGIAQNDRTPLDIAKLLWGGSILKRIRKSPASDKQCEGYEWRLCHNDALLFITDIKPYLLIPYKKIQIEKALQIAKEGIQRKFKCKYCGLEYASPGGRRRHTKSIHSNADASSSKNELRDNQIAGNPLSSIYQGS